MTKPRIQPTGRQFPEGAMSAESDLSTHFETLGLPDDAQAWLLDLWNVIQVFDDLVDGDPVAKSAALGAVQAVFLTMPMNAFARDHMTVLQPILALQFLKWQGANTVEGAGLANEKSYVWRAGFYDVVLMVCHLCGIPDAGHAVMEMYGEPFAEYMEGQPCRGH